MVRFLSDMNVVLLVEAVRKPPLQFHLPSALADGLINDQYLWTLVPF